MADRTEVLRRVRSWPLSVVLVAYRGGMVNAVTFTETAVIIPSDAAESADAYHRRHLDVAASWGVPAHVSVLYPCRGGASVPFQSGSSRTG